MCCLRFAIRLPDVSALTDLHVQEVVFTPDAVIAFSKDRMERRSTHTGKVTHQVICLE